MPMICTAPCTPADPATDSVKLDAAAIAQAQAQAQSEAEPVYRFEMGGGRFVEKHGASRLVVGAKDAKEADKVVAEWQAELERSAREEEEQAKERAEAEARERAAELERQRAEEQRRLEMEAERLRLEELLEEERRQREEQARRELQARREREERARLEREEDARRREAERLAQEREELERKEAVNTFCLQHGFPDIHAPRRSGCAVFAATATYALHVAAELADERIVSMLLKEGADPAQKNSSGKTPAQVAQRKNKHGSHEEVMRLLGSSARPCVGGA